MKNIAVIGAGISGLAAAYLLSRRHRVHLFEKEARLGGHTNTVVVPTPGGGVPLDTGFLVHNERTYPNLVRLSHLSLLREIVRFNREAPALLEAPDADRQTLGDFLESRRFGEGFTDRYLYPMASAIWSASLDAIRSFPALTLIRVFDNHGLLSLSAQPTWKVVVGGSHTSVLPVQARARASWNCRIAGAAGAPPTVTYDLNRLQGLTTPDQYCVTLNPDDGIDERRVLRRFVYRHPLHTREAIRAQRQWDDLSGVNRTHYCGAYWRYGFHEDGLQSALRVAHALGVEW